MPFRPRISPCKTDHFLKGNSFVDVKSKHVEMAPFPSFMNRYTSQFTQLDFSDEVGNARGPFDAHIMDTSSF